MSLVRYVPISLFCSYSHKDIELKDQLFNHLSLLRRQGVVDIWHDREICPGQDWVSIIDKRLEAARVVLLLISSDFLASDYCYGIEMNRALSRQEEGAVQVLPIILRPVDWHSAPFARLKCLPEDGFPVTSWNNRDEAFANVAKGVRRAIFAQSVEGFQKFESFHARREERFEGFESRYSSRDDYPGHSRNRLWERVAQRASPQETAEWGDVIIDDVIKSRDRATDLILLDVRIRNAGSRVANLTRANLRIIYEKHAPVASLYKPSASYDLRVAGSDNVISIAHSLTPGEVDSFILRVETSHDYVRLARIEIRYNREYLSMSEIFWL